MSTFEYPKAEGLHHNPAFSQVVVAKGTRTIHISGQVAVDEKGALVGGNDPGQQTTQVMSNLGRALASAGASFADVVKITTYVVGYKPELRPVIAQARAPFFASRTPPASTLVGVSALAMPEWLVEIEAVAITD